MISVIIPLAPEEKAHHKLCEQLEPLPLHERILVSEAPVKREGWHYVESDIGRAKQLNAGAKAATGEYLWFLHADTRLILRESLSQQNSSLYDKLLSSIKGTPNALHYFKIGFYSGSPLMKLNAVGANFRSHFFGAPFGDQGFCIKKELFWQLGGFDEEADYGEDHLLALKSPALSLVNATIYTSARKYQTQGWLHTTWQHLRLWHKQYRRRKHAALAILVKTPGISPVKTRLAQEIGQEKAEAFFQYSLKKIEETALQAQEELAIKPYWAVTEKEALKHTLWHAFETIHSGEGGLGERILFIFNQLIKKNSLAILLGGDTPDVTIKHLQKTCSFLNANKGYVIGPSDDGGFYLLAGNVPLPKTILNVAYSQNSTREEFAACLNYPIHYLEELIDGDTKEQIKQILPAAHPILAPELQP